MLKWNLKCLNPLQYYFGIFHKAGIWLTPRWKWSISQALEMGVLKNFANFTGKHLCWCFFLIKLQASGHATLLKKRLQHGDFPVKFAKFLRTPFCTEHFRWLLLQFPCSFFCSRTLLNVADRFFNFLKLVCIQIQN